MNFYATFMCSRGGCRDPSHLEDIREAYSCLIDALIGASGEFARTVGGGEGARVVVGWNDYCREKYGMARGAFLRWKAGGRCRSGELYEEMKRTRRSFKRAFNFCKTNEQKIKNEKVMEKFN